MNSIKMYLMFWLTGLVAGVVLMERWRRHGGRYVPVESVEAAWHGQRARLRRRPTTSPRTSALIVGWGEGRR